MDHGSILDIFDAFIDSKKMTRNGELNQSSDAFKLTSKEKIMKNCCFVNDEK